MKKKEPPVTVIILNYNGGSYVEQCLNSIFQNHYSNFDVMFIDNNSSDDGIERALAMFESNPRFALVRNSKNLGFSIGNNIGFKKSENKIRHSS